MMSDWNNASAHWFSTFKLRKIYSHSLLDVQLIKTPINFPKTSTNQNHHQLTRKYRFPFKKLPTIEQKILDEGKFKCQF